MNKYLLAIGSLLFSSATWALLNESDDEQGLKGTVIKDLRIDPSLPPYQSGEFPFQASSSTGMRYTNFCPEVREGTRTPLPVGSCSLAPPLREDGRCVVVEPEHQKSVLRRIIPGIDERVHVTNPRERPYRFHGHMIMKFPNGTESVGSGTLIGPHHVLTAGQNIYSHKMGEGWATSVRFISAWSDEEMPFTSAQGVVLLSVKNWVEDQNTDHNFGMVILDEAIGYQIGWAGMFAALDDTLMQNAIHVSGYPGDKGELNRQSTHMWTGVTTILRDRMTYDMETLPGQSGSGVWAEFPGYNGYYVVGVHAYGKEDQEGGSGATRLSVVKFDRLVNWMKEYQLGDFFHSALPSGEERTAREIYVTYKGEANRGEAESQYQLALCYTAGRGVEKKPGEAFKWYEKAAKQGHRFARRELALCYQSGIGTEKSIPKAKTLLLKLSEEKDSWAQSKIGTLYANGQGVPQNYTEAMRWYQLAAAQNDASAQNNIGILYDNDLGVAQDYTEAMRWYRLAAAQNDASAQNNIGVLYCHGLGIAQDYVEAVRWYRLAAAQNDASAQYNIGELYDNGLGVAQDYGKAMGWYRLAAAQNHTRAQYNIGELYVNGFGITQDYGEAMRWYRLAAAQNDASAQNSIGWLYDHGQGVAQDYAEAMRWYRFAADKGLAVALYNVGAFYANGLGVPQDYVEGVRYLQLAAAQNDETVQNNIAMLQRKAQCILQ